MSKVMYTVFSIPPQDKERNWTPCMLGPDDSILWLAYANEYRGHTGFKTRREARNAINRTRRYIKRAKLFAWSGEYKIVPVKLKP